LNKGYTLKPNERGWRLGRELAAVLMLCGSLAAHATPVSSAAQRLIETVDALDVEHHWPAGVHVNWQTGEPDGHEERTPGKHTHCSAFVASAAKHLNIYILRPPEHGQILLANAQFEWLANEGATQGWRSVSGPVAAQAEANEGRFVVATYRNHNDDKPGHIVIVRPMDKSDSAIRAEGPQITQAGGTNYRSTSLQNGFSGHPAAWGRGEVRYYSHDVPAQ
jgi:hypothetical protein